MIPQVNRLPSLEIPRVMKYGKRLKGDGITIIFRDMRHDRRDTNSRFAFIVAKAVDKRSTVRNRVKRMLSESVRHRLPTLHTIVDGVVIGRKELVGLTQEDVEKRVVHCISEL